MFRAATTWVGVSRFGLRTSVICHRAVSVDSLAFMGFLIPISEGWSSSSAGAGDGSLTCDGEGLAGVGGVVQPEVLPGSIAELPAVRGVSKLVVPDSDRAVKAFVRA